MSTDMPVEQLENLYAWVDELPLSRDKKNINRDFSDGVLMAELVCFYFPKCVEMHNYTPANNTRQKLANWRFLNNKVLRPHLNCEFDEEVIMKLAQGAPGVVEHVLMDVRRRIDQKLGANDQPQPFRKAKMNSHRESDKPEADQDIGAHKHARNKKVNSSAPDVLAPPFEKITTSKLSRNEPPPRPAVQKQRHEMTKKDMLELNSKFKEKEQELLEKDELIAILQAKVRRLEHLVELKDTRIDEIQYQLEQLRPTAGQSRPR